MPTINDVLLSITSASATHYKVKVTTKIGVAADEIGKKVDMAIALWAVQAPGDRPDDKEGFLAGPLYRFGWLNTGTKPITLTTAGTQTVTEERNLPISRLDEDPGFVQFPSPDINTPGQKVPRQDEVKAVVTLYTGKVTAQSSMVEFGGFVD